ncbi:MAG: hypothetical protein J1F35_08750 [Erysipelotrichales bacterium]|nr:hypothetical protein [Erysipelotrichales bacterium]
MKGYQGSETIFHGIVFEEKTPNLDYLKNNKFISQKEIESLIISAKLLIRDINDLFNYIEPSNENQLVYSHRLYELLLRIATEFESNCKGILRDNGYVKTKGNLNIIDYFNLNKVCRLHDYKIQFFRWESDRYFKPFNEWKNENYFPLPWYSSYNNVKHNRFEKFKEANLENVINALGGLLCIIHAQIGENVSEIGFNGIPIMQNHEKEVNTEYFKIKPPSFPEEEQYEFYWDDIKNGENPVQTYSF